MPEIYKVVYIALFVAFVILVLGRTGLRDKIADAAYIKGMSMFSEMVQCDLCLSFWVSFVLCFLLMLFSKDCSLILIPFLSTPITRFIL